MTYDGTDARNNGTGRAKRFPSSKRLLEVSTSAARYFIGSLFLFDNGKLICLKWKIKSPIASAFLREDTVGCHVGDDVRHAYGRRQRFFNTAMALLLLDTNV